MLNLSDNELDRLSREAASQHEPGDLLGPQSWERLELRLDKELGRSGPDPSSGGRGLRGFRRLPFQYAPVILLIVGVSYYFVKQAKGRKAEQSGSPPLTVVKTPSTDHSSNNPAYSDKSTSTPYHQDQSQNTDSGSAPDVASNAPAAAATSNTTPAPGRNTPPASSSNGLTPSNNDLASANTSRNNNLASADAHHNNDLASTGTSYNNTHNNTTHNHRNDLTGQSNTRRLSGQNSRRSGNHLNTQADRNNILTTGHDHIIGQNTTAGKNNNTGPTPGVTPQEHGPEYTFIQRPNSLRSHRPYIDDSALRAYTAQTPTNPGKKSGPSLRINRPLTFGFQVAPDFSSVNALAGDKPGSSIGVTVDYQIFDRWHIGTGLLFSKKNYTARGTDYKAPHWYYQSVGLKGVDFVKGSMTMLEIPLNVRYDFSITGNTIFFASGGVSTYLFGSENCNYYYDFFGREVSRTFKYPNKQNIFSAANLSLGVETGINNNFSIMVAPYMKVPMSDIGFGRIRMSSVGINVGLRYSPVLSRKRQH